ncbi:MAG TPA: ion channel [Rubrobacteraceae bacterium]|nr:ion channel [Rubrobacteraceae bacterium]
MSNTPSQPERDDRLGERERTSLEGRFGAVLVLLFIAVFFSIAAPEGSGALLLTTVVLAITLGIAMLASGVSARAARVWLGVAVLGVGFSIIIALTQESLRTAGGFLAITSLILTATTIGAIARRVLQYVEISVVTVLGAVCIYVLVGLSFAFAYEIVGSFGSQPFFASQQERETRSDYVYFSFITMATVGYGDLTAQGGLGRALAVTEGLLGQIYLVTAVAALVSNVGRASAPRKRDGR